MKLLTYLLELYLIDIYYFNNNDVYVNIKLLLNLLKGDSVIYSRLIKALEKLENSKNKYHPSKKVTKKICLMLDSKIYRYFSIEPFKNRFCDINFNERRLFKNTEDVIYLRL